MGTEVELHSLVDLALRNPEVGVVNFNHLHALLHAILNHIGLSLDPRVNTTTKFETVLPISRSVVGNERESVINNNTADKGRYSQGNEHGDMSRDVSENQRRNQGVPDINMDWDELHSMTSRQDHVEKKVLELEEKLQLVDQLPTNKEIINWAQQSGQTESGLPGKVIDKESMLSGMWQFMKIDRRLQALEDGIERTMSILNEFLSGGGESIKQLQNGLKNMSDEIQTLKKHMVSSMSGAGDAGGSSTTGSEPNESKLHPHTLHEKLSNFVTKDDLQLYVTWPALEEALNITKSDPKRNKVSLFDVKRSSLKGDVLDVSMGVVEEREVITDDAEGRVQSAPAPPPSQTPVSLPEAPKTALTWSTQVNAADSGLMSNHPSPEVVECLRQIAELSKHQEDLVQVMSDTRTLQQEIEGNVLRIEGGLQQKVDKEELKIPEDLQDQLAMLKKGLDFLNTNQDLVALAEIKKMTLDNKQHVESMKREFSMLARQNKPVYIEKNVSIQEYDNDVLKALKDHMLELQSEQERSISKIGQGHSAVVEDLNRKQDHIDVLYSYVERLQDSKADKENVATEMNVKADKEELESKVNVSTFDSTFGMLDEGLREALQKMDNYLNEELTLKLALKQLSIDMSEKMDGQAFQALQNYLERRIANVQKSRNLIARETKVDLSHAAGLRRPLSKFHCISCNRPVDAPTGDQIHPTLPHTHGVRIKRSKAPYLSYEIDQIRHHQKAHSTGSRPEKTVSELMSGRPCGGMHTVTRQQLRKPTRVTQLGQVLVREDPQEFPNWSRDLSVMDLLKGSDGQVYKGRYKQLTTIPPIPKKYPSPPPERDNYPDSAEWRTRSADQTYSLVQTEQEKDEMSPRMQEDSPRSLVVSSNQSTPPSSRKSSPRSRMKNVVKRHSSVSTPIPAPSLSPPTVRENEYQQLLQKQQREELSNQREGPSKLFYPGLRQPEMLGTSAESPVNNSDNTTTVQTINVPQSEESKEVRGPITHMPQQYTSSPDN